MEICTYTPVVAILFCLLYELLGLLLAAPAAQLRVEIGTEKENERQEGKHLTRFEMQTLI
jgi:hypothetical protein